MSQEHKSCSQQVMSYSLLKIVMKYVKLNCFKAGDIFELCIFNFSMFSSKEIYEAVWMQKSVLQ
jgi:hypothetical protein